MHPKTRKLLTSPQHFVRDMVRNQVARAKERLPQLRRVPGHYRFSVVVCVGSTSPDLSKLIRSSTRQTLDLDRRIELLIVSDGTWDSAGLQPWLERHTTSIRVLTSDTIISRATAWNRGLRAATGDWVTFVSPGDFFADDYFEKIDEFLGGPYAGETFLCFGRTLVYRKDRAIVTNSDPLRYRFSKGNTTRNESELTRHIQPSTDGAFFQVSRLHHEGICLDERLSEGFDECDFVSRYLLSAKGTDVGFVARAQSYRMQLSHPVSRSITWDAEQLQVDLEIGCEKLLRGAELECGSTPVWLQQTVLYKLVELVRGLINHEERLKNQSHGQRSALIATCRRIFEHIDKSTIQGFKMTAIKRVEMVGLLGMFQGQEPDEAYVRAELYDHAQQLLQLRHFFWGNGPQIECHLGGQEIKPVYDKVRRYELFGETFARERILWLPIRATNDRLRIHVDGELATIGITRRVYRGGVLVNRLLDAIKDRRKRRPPWYVRVEQKVATARRVERQYAGAFLFIDRDFAADDNAEHLYRYVLQNHPEIPAYFILRRTSPDWARLEREGFRLIDFGSRAHRHALVHARHLISSHAAPFVLSVVDPKSWGDILRYRFTFLQHGVTKDDMSSWLNSRRIDCLVAASPAEYAAFVGDGPYKFSEREVTLSGFPRHDALGSGRVETERKLLIMPTWRQSITGALKRRSSERSVNTAFYESEYALRWRSILHSKELKQAASEHDFSIEFVGHPNIEPYLEWFALPSHIYSHNSHGKESMQASFQSSAIMLTDYSSTAFEMAYLHKPVVYYQFDRDDVFGGSHTTKKGYFDYESDGFGPVFEDEASVLSALRRLMAADSAPDPVYRSRMERTFAFRDGKACERVLAAILNLDEPAVAPGISAHDSSTNDGPQNAPRLPNAAAAPASAEDT